ncbi:hypothetical protein [Pseudomonas gingeri]|uniref:hypothetical protein n=1 Tax=Pseudomonas gingeri TaxID=117681 RepID=UPI0015A1884B|nr:hypothetical protein [Pseudomonas gingeri]NVZ64749.1 hypothetical protein [Pseudomonas gingeri]NVZ78186.1 hypothetical protein [Pseudomonas gingeri]NWA09003.1 hypothetical protein [Pseudomonas gingeri]
MNVTTRRNPSLPFNNFMNCPQTLGNTSLEQRLKSAVKKTVFFRDGFSGRPAFNPSAAFTFVRRMKELS